MNIDTYITLQPTPHGAIQTYTGLTHTRQVGGTLDFYGTLYNAQCIDTRSLDVRVNVTCDRNVMVQDTEVVQFKLTVIYRDNSYDVIWQATTSDPVGGFSVPRKIFVIPQWPKAVSYLSLSAVYAQNGTSHEFLYATDPRNQIIRVTQVYSLPPVISYVDNSFSTVEPPTISLSYTSGGGNVPFGVQVHPQSTSSLTWFISKYSWAQDDATESIPHIEYDFVLQRLHVNDGAYYDGQAFIIAKNVFTQATSALPIMLKVVRKPELIIPTSNIVHSISESYDFFYKVQLSPACAPYTGKLDWRVEDAVSGISINRNGQVKIARGSVINREVAISATNIAGGQALGRIPFKVAQSPVLYPIGNVIQSRTSTTTATVIRVPETMVNDKTTLSWYLRTNGLGINAIGSDSLSILQNGTVLAQPNTYIRDLVTVGVSNIIGSNAEHTFEVHLAQRPLISMQRALSNLYIGEDGSYVQPLIQSSTGVGVQTWKLLAVNPPSLKSQVSVINSNNIGYIKGNVLNGYIDAHLTISVANIIADDNGFDKDIFHVVAAQQPRIFIPESSNIKGVIERDGVFRYQFSNLAPGAGNITWSVSPVTSASGTYSTGYRALSLDANTGAISLPFSSNAFLCETLNVTATNTFGVSHTVPILFDVQHQLYMNSNSSLFSFVNGVRAIKGTMSAGSNYILDLKHILTSDQGVNMDTVTWKMRTPVSTVAVLNSNTGVITVPYDNRISIQAEVTVSSTAGAGASIETLLVIVQATKIFNPKIITNNSDTTDFIYQLRQTAIGTGGFSWGLTTQSGSNINTIPGVSLVSSETGVIRVAPHNYVNAMVVAKTQSVDTQDVQSVMFKLHIAQRPSFEPWNQIFAKMYGDNSYSFPAYAFMTAIGTGTLTWQISPFPNLSINQNGVITFEHHNSIADYVVVTAFNATGGFDSHKFYMNVSQLADLVNLTDFSWSMPYKTPLRLPLDTTTLAINADTWSISPSIPSSIGTFNTSTGLITIFADRWIDQVFSITVTKKDGTTTSESFRLRVAQTPVYAFPGSVLRVTHTSGTVISMSDYRVSDISGEGPLQWSMLPTRTGMTMNANTGQIVIASSLPYIDGTFTMTGINIGNGRTTPSARFIIARTPVLSSVPDIYITTIGYGTETPYNPLPVTPDETFTGPLTWSIEGTIPPIRLSDYGVSMLSFGRISIAAGKFIENQVVAVRAQNNAGGFDTKTFKLTISRPPALEKPQVNTGNSIDTGVGPAGVVEYGIYYSASSTRAEQYQMTQTPIASVGQTIEWVLSATLPSDSLPDGLSINHSTGIINVPTGTYNIGVTVTARNFAHTKALLQNPNGSSDVSFRIQRILAPVLSQVQNVADTLSDADYIIPIWEVTPGACGPLTYTHKPNLFGSKIESKKAVTGVNSGKYYGSLTFSKDVYVNTTLQVNAFNTLGETSTDMLFTVRLARAPRIQTPLPTLISTNRLRKNFTAQFVQTERATGPLLWTAIATPSQAFSNFISSLGKTITLQFDSSSGLLTIPYGYAFDGTVTVSVSNSLDVRAEVANLPISVYQEIDLTGTQASKGFVNKSWSSVMQTFEYDEFKVAYDLQKSFVGQLEWTITPTNPQQSQWLSISISDGKITYTGPGISETVTVTAKNVLNHTITTSFRLNVVQTPIINNPGTLYFSNPPYRYQYNSLVPYINTLDLKWETSEYDGIAIDEATGLFNYTFTNLSGDQNLYVTRGNTTTQYDVFADTLTAGFVFTGTNSDILRLDSLSVSRDCGWISPPSSSAAQVAMNPTLGEVRMKFPANSILNRTVKVSASNAALGYDEVQTSINLENVVIQMRPQTILQVHRTSLYAPTNNQKTMYKLTSDDSNINRIRPPAFAPNSYQGGTTMTFTWDTTPIAPVYLTWVPVTTYNQPAIYYPSSINKSLTVSGFMVNRNAPYLFTANIQPTPTTLAESSTFTYTPTSASAQNLISILQPRGGTTVMLRFQSAFATNVLISWTPTTGIDPITMQVRQGVLEQKEINGFKIDTEYTFKYVFDSDDQGIYDSYVYVSPTPYRTTYEDIGVIVDSPVTIDSERRVSLSWRYPAGRTTTGTIVFQPIDDLTAPIISYDFGINETTYTTIKLGLGVTYNVTYMFNPDSTGYFGSATITQTVLVRTIVNPIIATPTGGTILTVSWSVTPRTYCIISWTDVSSGNIKTRTLSPLVSSATIGNFTVGQPARVTYAFAPNDCREWPPGRLVGLTTVITDQSDYGIGIGNPYNLTSQAGTSPWNAFDKTTDTYWQLAAASLQTPTASLEIRLPQEIRLAAYHIARRTDVSLSAPVSWKVEARRSADGVNAAYERVHEVNGVSWAIDTSKTFVVLLSSSYDTFRLVPLAVSVGSSSVDVVEWRLYEFIGTVPKIAYLDRVITPTPYIPQYRVPQITLNEPQHISASSVVLSWRYTTNARSTTGKIVYTPAPIFDVNGNIIPQNDVEILFTKTDTQKTLTGLVLGYTYNFGVLFDPDDSGVYGSLVLTYTHTVKTIPNVIFYPITGGTQLYMSWRLSYINESGQEVVMSTYGTIITWDPMTASMGLGKLVSNRSDVVLTGFDGNGSTSYTFLFTFSQTPLTYSYTTPWSYMNSSGQLISTYTPALIETNTPEITITAASTGPGFAALTISWMYGYGTGPNFTVVDTNVRISWNLPTAISQPRPVSAPAKSDVIDKFLWGTQYIFTFEFDPDAQGIAVGKIFEYTYTVPRNPVVNLLPFEKITNTSMKISWTCDVDTTVITTLSPIGDNSGVITDQFSSSVGEAEINGLTRYVTYQVTVLFTSTSLTWNYSISREYQNL